MSCKGLKGVKLAQCKKRYERNAAAGLKRTGKPSFHKTHPKGWTKNQSDFSKKYEKMNSDRYKKENKKFTEIIYADNKTVSKKPKKKNKLYYEKL